MNEATFKDFTVKDFLDIYLINFNSGIVRFRQRRNGRKAAGSIVGSKDVNKHIRTELLGKRFFIHQLLFFVYHGFVPEEIDHINQIKDDNRICNLRAACHHTNKGNIGLIKTNTSGYRGVTWDKYANKWKAALGMERNGKKRTCKHLGNFICPIEAAKAYDKAATEYFGEFAFTNFPRENCIK